MKSYIILYEVGTWTAWGYLNYCTYKSVVAVARAEVLTRALLLSLKYVLFSWFARSGLDLDNKILISWKQIANFVRLAAYPFQIISCLKANFVSRWYYSNYTAVSNRVSCTNCLITSYTISHSRIVVYQNITTKINCIQRFLT